jgi:hypothetical protein
MSNDMQIQITGNVPVNIQIRSGPTYLISLAEGTISPYFLATKIDEGPSTVKAVGLFTNKNAKLQNIMSGHSTMISGAKPEDMVEMSFPWHQVHSIQNLIYRHKGTK